MKTEQTLADDFEPQTSGKTARRRRQRQRRAARAAIFSWAAQQVEERERQIEQLLAERVCLLQMTRCEVLTIEQEGQRIALALTEAFPITPEAEQRQFLGLNLFAWVRAPAEMLAVFGLTEAANRWRSQLYRVSDSADNVEASIVPVLH